MERMKIHERVRLMEHYGEESDIDLAGAVVLDRRKSTCLS